MWSRPVATRRAKRSGQSDTNCRSPSCRPASTPRRFRPLSEDERLAARSRFGIPADTELIVSISRLVPRKGFDTAIRAAAILRRTRPNVMLAISGGGRDEKRLRKLVAELGAPVRFLGRVANEDLPALYGCADVYTMLCRNRWRGLEQEGFGIVFLEAAACEVPQVAGDSGGAEDAVIDGVTGLMVRHADDVHQGAHEAARAFARLLDDPALRIDDGSRRAATRGRAVLVRRVGEAAGHRIGSPAMIAREMSPTDDRPTVARRPPTSARPSRRSSRCCRHSRCSLPHSRSPCRSGTSDSPSS